MLTASAVGSAADSLPHPGDSTDTTDAGDRSSDRLVDDGTLDDAGRAGLIDDAQSVLDGRERGPSPSFREFFKPLSAHVSCELEAVTGSRSEAGLRVREAHGFSCGARRLDGEETGFVRYEGRGFFRCVHVGGMTMRFGDRLILGRSFGRFASSDEGTVRGTMSISPSFSRWYGVSGTAAEISRGRVRCGAALVGPPEGLERWRPNTVWGWGVLELRRIVLGAMAGRPAANDRDAVDSDSGSDSQSASSSGEHPGAASFHAAFRGDAFATSAEIARLDGSGVFYGVRVTDGGRARRLRYSILLFRAPHDAPVEPAGIVPARSLDQGARIDGSARIGGVRPSVSLLDAASAADSKRASYRRAILRIENDSRSSFSWEVATDIAAAYEARYPSAPVDTRITGSSRRQWRTRVTLTTGDGGTLESSVRVEYLPGMDGTGPAVLLELSTELASAQFESRLQLAVHDISPGRRLSLWKPGVGSFERITSLYAKGSDFVWRGRVRISGGVRLVASYETAWPGRAWLYVGVEYGR
jgi:hypothetical protein